METTMTGRIFAPIFLILAALSLAGCGGGGGGGQPATGDVAVVFTDGPTDRFQRILVSMSSMSLIGPGGHVSLYDGPDITFDLLDMSEWGDLAFNTKVLAGPYNKIRMEVSKIELMDMTTETTVTLDKLPAGGKIDLNPQGQFEVSPDYTTVIKLDMDAKRSFQVVETGNGKLQFRPIVFVEIFQGDIFLPDRLVRVFGTVEAGSIGGADTTGDSTDDSFRLCGLTFIAQTDGPVVGDPADCVRVYADGAPSVFDATGAEVDFSAVTADANMTAVGFLVDTDDAGAILGLNSVVLELGDRQPDVAGGWATIQGVVTTDPVGCTTGTGQCFDFDPDETDPAETVRMQSGTRVFRADGVELGQSDVSTGDGASIDAVPGATDLQAALVVLSNDAASGAVTGVLDSVDTADDGTTVRLNITTDVGGQARVCVDADTAVLHVLVDDDSVTIFDLLDPGILETGLMIEAYGDASSPPAGCDFVADQVIVGPPPAMP
jgi:hypothetical protein